MDTSANWGQQNTIDRSSVLGYIPESAWDESGAMAGSQMWATGGGASILWNQPSWQTSTVYYSPLTAISTTLPVLGMPADGKRHVPDVALNAAQHTPYLIFRCPVNTTCDPGVRVALIPAAGTSAATPAFAAIVALLQQGFGRMFDLNQRLYQLANRQYLVSGAPVFHDITQGSNIVTSLNNVPRAKCNPIPNPCVPSNFGYWAGPGYDQATGLGSVDAAQFFNNWTRVF